MYAQIHTCGHTSAHPMRAHIPMVIFEALLASNTGQSSLNLAGLEAAPASEEATTTESLLLVLC